MIVLGVFVPDYFAYFGVCMWLFFAFMAGAALVFSLQHWNERRTAMQLSQQGIRFRDGVRQLEMNWDEIERIQVHPSKINDRIIVQSETAAFTFQTLGKMMSRGRMRDQIGFEQGDMILETILSQTGLKDRHEEQGYHYYSRH